MSLGLFSLNITYLNFIKMKKSLFVANSMVISGVVLAIIGVFAIVCAESFFPLVIQIAGGAIALMSLFMLVMRIIKRNTGSKLEFAVMLAMFSFALIGGILLICFAEPLTRIFAVIIGAVILLSAVAMLILTLVYREKNSVQSWIYLIASLVVIIAVGIIGYMFIANQEFANKLMATVLGVIMILLGLLFLFESFMVRKVIKLFNENILTEGRNDVAETVDAEAEVVEEEKTAIE